jgi:hypothetical protein
VEECPTPEDIYTEEEVHRPEALQEDHLVHQEEAHQEDPSGRQEDHQHLFPLLQSSEEAGVMTSWWAIPPSYSKENVAKPKSSSLNGNYTKGSTSPTT